VSGLTVTFPELRGWKRYNSHAFDVSWSGTRLRPYEWESIAAGTVDAADSGVPAPLGRTATDGTVAAALAAVAEDRAVLHHEDYIAGCFDIGQRIARHRHNIRQHSGFERAHSVLQAQKLGGH